MTNANGAPPSPDDNDKEVSLETSKRICKHMNEDHAVSVFAMAQQRVVSSSPPLLPAGWKLTSARLKKISMQGCDVQAITCSGDLCEMKNIFYPFEPPLKRSSEVRKRMIDIHHDVIAPKVHWLVTKPLALAIVIITLLLAYGVLVMGTDNLAEAIENAPMLNRRISFFFGSAAGFAQAVRVSFWFAILAHGAEATYGLVQCKKKLKLKWKPSLLWYGLIFAVGYPIFSELQLLLSKATSTAKKQDNNKSS